MIVFNEGLPGSGKSYDAMATHILPALKAGRHVYARLNGIDDPERVHKIAEHIQQPTEYVLERLHHVTDEQVHEISAHVKQNALVVIDECHEFYVASREPMAKDKEELFAKHRHLGLDILLISQYYKRLHSAVRGRVERKAIFTKLTVAKMKNRYKVEHWQAVAPDKYEKVDSVVRKYDPAIFPLYRSVVDGTTNLEVYEAGSVSAWRKVAIYAAVMIPLSVWAVWILARFFSPHDSSLVKAQHVPGVVASAAPVAQVAPAAPGSPTQRGAQLDTSKKKGYDTTGMPPAVAYVFDIASQARPRLAAVYYVQGASLAEGLVEFREAQGHVLERLSLRQLRDMGLRVRAETWGVLASFGDANIVATPWPIDMPGRISDERNSEIDSMPAWAEGRAVVPAASSVPVARTSTAIASPSKPIFKHYSTR